MNTNVRKVMEVEETVVHETKQTRVKWNGRTTTTEDCLSQFITGELQGRL